MGTLGDFKRKAEWAEDDSDGENNNLNQEQK
jgi:hypothetical protein